MPISTIQPSGAPGDGSLGTRNDRRLRAIFASSPLYGHNVIAYPAGYEPLTLTPTALKIWHQENVVNGVVPDSGQYYDVEAPLSMDFNGAGASIPGGPPDIAKLQADNRGVPVLPFVPDVRSPGEGNGVEYQQLSQTEAESVAEQILQKKPSTPGSGAAANEPSRNPSFTSSAMKTNVFGQTLGQSPATTSKP